jgi:phosphoenolpyruvate-protein kinase (PTS system EI component)
VRGVSPGRARGPVVVLEERSSPPVSDPSAALQAVGSELTALADSVGGDAAEILQAQAAMARDPEIAKAAAASDLPPAEAIAAAFAPFRAMLEEADDDYQRQRTGDIDDIVSSAQAVVEGRARRVRTPPVPGILVAASISPADTALIPRGELLGIVSGDGSPASHAAIIARALGIPAVLGAADLVDRLKAGEWVALDGDIGTVERVPAGARATVVQSGGGHLPSPGRAFTADGEAVEVRANIGGVAEAEAAREARIEGSGLVRTEFLFAGRATPPTVDEQAEVYARILEALPGEVVFRALDAGSDKPLEYAPADSGANPALGLRGIRLLLRHPDLLADQLRALCRAGAPERVRLMLPMVSRATEVEHARSIASEVFAAEGVELQLGAMIEVPVAALGVAELARVSDFFSIGTNDLLQYLLASDRAGEHWVGEDRLPPAAWRLLAQVFDDARSAGRPVGVCGELAAHPEWAGALWALGATSLSIAPAQAGRLATALAGRDAAGWRDVAERATRP